MPTSSKYRNDTTGRVQAATHHPDYTAAIAAVAASREAKARGDALAERRALRAAQRMIERILGDVRRGRLS